jgi:hypothetical protein
MVGRQKLNGVAQALDLPGLVVGRPAGFQQYGGRGAGWRRMEAAGSGTGAFADRRGRVLGRRRLRNGLCQVDGDGRMLLHGLLLQKEWL